jgi:hypothetical protein
MEKPICILGLVSNNGSFSGFAFSGEAVVYVLRLDL